MMRKLIPFVLLIACSVTLLAYLSPVKNAAGQQPRTAASSGELVAMAPINPHQLMRAVEALGRPGENRESLELLFAAALAEARDPVVRQTALRTLAPLAREHGWLRKQLVPVVAAALDDPEVRLAAIEAAGILGRDARVLRSTLVNLANEGDASVKKPAKLALDRVDGWLHGPVDVTRKQWVSWGLYWIVQNQRGDGGFHSAFGDNRPAIVVSTAFCGLALLASGANFDSELESAAGYVTYNLFHERSGAAFPRQWDQSNWKIGIGGLFLCEYYAALKAKSPGWKSDYYDELIQQVVDSAFERMEASGGWGHTPRVANALGYVELQMMSNWMLAMIGSAKKLGAKVPEDKLQQALYFVQNCCSEGSGGVGYSPWRGQRGFGCPCRTGGAIFTYALLGQQRHPHYDPMADWWANNYHRSGQGHGSASMGLLASALGARQLGGECWQCFADTYFPGILASSYGDGSFRVTGGTGISGNEIDNRVGTAYVTGIFTLILQLDRGHLHFLGERQRESAADLASNRK